MKKNSMKGKIQNPEKEIKEFFQIDIRCLHPFWPTSVLQHQDDSVWVWLFVPTHQAVCRAILYLDEPKNIYLDHLYVHPKYRMKGVGKFLQEIREQLGKHLGCTHSYLYVIRNSWMDQWYHRRGYQFHSDEVENHSDSYWKIKSLT